MRFLFALVALVVVPGCMLDFTADGEPPRLPPCAPIEAPIKIVDGAYGSGAGENLDLAVYPSFRTDHPQRMVFDRATSSLRIEYVHETKTVVEQWTVGAITTERARENHCEVTGHERAELNIASVTIDGVAGDLTQYRGWSATLRSGQYADAYITHRRLADGHERAVGYGHGASPRFSSSCDGAGRPVDGTFCDFYALCAYPDDGAQCTTRCGRNNYWQSFGCN